MSVIRHPLLASLVTTLLAGCSTVPTLDVTVASQGQWPADRKPGTYAFERLPSQQANPLSQELAEAAARPAIERLGFRAVPAEQAEVLVQVGTRIIETWRPDPFGGWNGAFWVGRPWPYWGSAWGPWGPGWGPGWGGGSGAIQEYLVETGVMFRAAAGSAPLYETRARLSSRSGNSRYFAPLFDASLRDFPGPALSPRSVTVTPVPPPARP